MKVQRHLSLQARQMRSSHVKAAGAFNCHSAPLAQIAPNVARSQRGAGQASVLLLGGLLSGARPPKVNALFAAPKNRMHAPCPPSPRLCQPCD